MTTMPLLSDLFEWNDDHDNLIITRVSHSADKMHIVVCYERVDYGEAEDIKEFWQIDVLKPI